MTPALHCAIVSRGCETMKSGAPTTGSLVIPERMGGNGIRFLSIPGF
jgi:hypothetical protein